MPLAVKGSVDFFPFFLLQFKPREKRLKISLMALKSLCSVNPFTAKCGQRQISTKVPNLIFFLKMS